MILLISLFMEDGCDFNVVNFELTFDCRDVHVPDFFLGEVPFPLEHVFVAFKDFGAVMIAVVLFFEEVVLEALVIDEVAASEPPQEKHLG